MRSRDEESYQGISTGYSENFEFSPCFNVFQGKQKDFTYDKESKRSPSEKI